MKKIILVIFASLVATVMNASVSSKAEAFFNSGMEKYQNGDYEGALIDLNGAIKLSPNYAEAYCARGDVSGILSDKAGIDNFETSFADFNKAIKLNPALIEAYFLRGDRFFRLRNYNNAISDYSKIIELDPSNQFAYYNRSLVNKQLRRLKAAGDDYKKAVELGFTPESLPGGEIFVFYIIGIILLLLLIAGIVVFKVISANKENENS